MEENSVWKSCITTKYEPEDGGWFTPLSRGSYGVGLWKIIAKESSQLKEDGFSRWGMVGKSYFRKTTGMEECLYTPCSL